MTLPLDGLVAAVSGAAAALDACPLRRPAPQGTAFTAHRRLVDIHPVNDGNRRTARLVMNLMLIRGCCPPVSIRPADRGAHLAALQAGQGSEAFERLLYQRLFASLRETIAAYGDA